MRYWKFLKAGSRSRFTNYAWSPGRWQHSDEHQPCVSGFHACRTTDLPYWLDDELWRIDLDSDVIEFDHKVVATRARMVDQVAEWTTSTARELATACTLRVLHHAAAELAHHGVDDAAVRLTQAADRPDPEHWVSTARACTDLAYDADALQAIRLCRYVEDAVETLMGCPVASSAYVAARVASERSSTEDEDPYLAERAWQAGWLVDRLSLDRG